MRLHSSHEQAHATRVHFQFEDKTDVWVNTYIGTNIARGQGTPALTHGKWEPDDPDNYPMAFLVEQTPGSTTKPHFHRADQFQVFVAGHGQFEGKPVEPMTIHFAGAYSAYGPILAGPEGISYFTLRNSWDPGARWMPENRDELKRSGRQYRSAVVEPRTAPAPPLHALTQVELATLIPAAPDGLAAWSIRIPPGTQWQGPNPSAGGGQYWLVLNGSCVAGEARLARLSCLFLSRDESSLTIRTESGGVELIAMQYPRHA